MTLLSQRWQQIYIGLADKFGQASKDASNKVGAILVRPNKRVASMGVNGFPSRIVDNAAYLSDVALRHKKYPRMVHAEANCIDCNLDPDTTGYHLFVNMHPCGPCALRIANTGISYVYYKPQPDFEARWADSVREAKEIFEEANVIVVRVEREVSPEVSHLLGIFAQLTQMAIAAGQGPSEDEIAAALDTLTKLTL